MDRVQWRRRSRQWVLYWVSKQETRNRFRQGLYTTWQRNSKSFPENVRRKHLLV